MTAFDYQQWRTSSAVTPEMLDSCLDRIAELEAELERIDSFDGHLGWLHEHYPETAFDGSSGDIGAVNVVLSRKLLEAEAELAALKGRRCETCAWLKASLGQYECGGVTELRDCPDPDDFCCNRWAEGEKP